MARRILELQDIVKSYDGKSRAVDRLSLCLEAGNVCALLGKNGAGKTTSIRIIMGLLPFDSGSVQIKGQQIGKSYPLSIKSCIGFVPDCNSLYGYLTGYQYLRFLCGMYQLSFRESMPEIRQLAAQLQLEPYLNKLIRTYSKGTVQKLMTLGAFLHHPELMIMDEPFTSLDPEMIVTVLKLIRQRANEGCAFLISSHIISLVERVCDSYTILKEGITVAQGETAHLEAGTSLEEVYFESIDSSVE